MNWGIALPMLAGSWRVWRAANSGRKRAAAGAQLRGADVRLFGAFGSMWRTAAVAGRDDEFEAPPQAVREFFDSDSEPTGVRNKRGGSWRRFGEESR